jgi:hypothetical protein
VVWAVWHVIPLLSALRSLAFIAWWSLGTVALRVVIVWLYNLAIALCQRPGALTRLRLEPLPHGAHTHEQS